MIQKNGIDPRMLPDELTLSDGKHLNVLVRGLLPLCHGYEKKEAKVARCDEMEANVSKEAKICIWCEWVDRLEC